MKCFFWLFLVVIASGCSRPSEFKAITEFREKHPDDAKLFVHIYPVNLDLFREMLGGRALSIQTFAHGLEREFDKVQGVKEFAEQKEREDREDRNTQYKEYQELERLSENGGLVCEYEWNNKEVLEVGLLVLKNGEVIKRDEWTRKIVDPALVKKIDEHVDELDRKFREQTNGNQ